MRKLTAGQIAESLKVTFAPYIEDLDKYSEADFAFKQSEEIWSLAQMYEHLLFTGNGFFMERLVACLEEKGEIGGEPNDSGKYIIYKNAFPNKKYKRPDTETIPLIIGRERAHYKTEFPKMLLAYIDLVPSIEKDAGEHRKRHFYFDMLNAKEWFQNMEIHIRHHLIQKEELEGYL